MLFELSKLVYFLLAQLCLPALRAPDRFLVVGEEVLDGGPSTPAFRANTPIPMTGYNRKREPWNLPTARVPKDIKCAMNSSGPLREVQMG